MKESSASLLPIIMVTGHTERRRIEAARDAGVTELLAKPITAAGLFQRIEEIVHRPRPFVRTANYFGPCRRRRANRQPSTGPWRQGDDAMEDRIDLDVTRYASGSCRQERIKTGQGEGPLIPLVNEKPMARGAGFTAL